MNKDLILQLNILANQYEILEDTWRYRAYKKTIFAIKPLKFQITNINQLKKTKNIGKGIKSKINEFLNTGSIQKIEENRELLSKTNKGVQKVFESIWGIGPVKAKQLVSNGIISIKQLRQNQSLLTTNQKIGLTYYEDLLKPVERDYITLIKLCLKVILIQKYGLNSFKLEITGSYRRGKDCSGDIDCLVTSERFNLRELVGYLKEWEIITEILSMKEEKFMGIGHCPDGSRHYFRIDIEFLPKEEWGSGLLYFTGSKEFNVAMRAIAKKRGYVLNQHGLFKKDRRLPLYREEQFMEFLDIEYIKPENR